MVSVALRQGPATAAMPVLDGGNGTYAASVSVSAVFACGEAWLEIRVGAAGSEGELAHIDGSPFGLVIDRPPVDSRLRSGAQWALLRD